MGSTTKKEPLAVKLSAWLDRLFYEEYWAVAYRTLETEQAERLTCDTRTHAFTLAAPPAGGWAADPFLFADGDAIYLFCEMVKKHSKTGVIGCAKWQNGSFTRPVPVLSPGCHTSYPAVFRHEDKIYMIPETRAKGSVELYEAVRFPYEWAHTGTLLSGHLVEDATPFLHDGGVSLFLYEPDDAANTRTLSLAVIDFAACALQDQVPLARYRAKLGRPAGAICDTARGLIRPTQHSIRRYGERIVYKRIDFSAGYAEYDIATLSPASIRLNRRWRLLGVHTINRLDTLEVIDVFYRRFSLLRPLRALLYRLKRGNV